MGILSTTLNQLPMAKISRKAGQNIRELALKRRLKAISSFGTAGLVLFIPFFANSTLEKLLKPISSLNSSQQQSSSSLPIAFYLLFLLLAVGLVANGIFWWKRAGNASQGAKGEEETAQEMVQLEREGWQIEYGLRLGNRLGDADIVCISPQNKSYVIDVKSHKGEVITDGKQLYKRMGKSTYPFEKNFLQIAIEQALQVKKQKDLSFVTPIVAFSNAKVVVLNGKVKKVYVVEKSKLVSLLRSLG
jgi:Nuclease-related domain